MGLSIGQAAASVAAVRPASLVTPNLRGTAASSEGRAGTDGSVTIGQPQASTEERVVSVAGAALLTLDTNFASARRFTASFRELSEENRVQRDAAAAAALEESEAVPPVEGEQQAGEVAARVESLRPEPSAQVRNFETEERADVAAVSFVPPSDAPDVPAPEATTPSRIDVLV